MTVPHARRVGHQAIGARVQIAHATQRRASHRRRIEHGDVRGKARREATPSGDAEEIGGACSEHLHRLLEREHALFADPVREQSRRERRVTELARMRSGVGEPEDGRGVGQQLADRGLVVVHHRHAKARLEIGRECEIEDEIDGVHAADVFEMRSRPPGKERPFA